MEFLSQTYVALRGPTGAQQTPTDAIVKLSDRLSPATLLADRRAAVLSLKGLSRDCSKEVGERALPGLLEVLVNDAEVDVDIGKAVLETLNMLCKAEQDGGPAQREIGLRHTDQALANEKATHTLFALLSDANFYIRLSTLQFLSTLLLNRRQLVQGYFLTTLGGARSVISVLEDKREIICSEAISLVQSLISQSPNIQKILAFEGAFERLFKIITQEGGMEGGVVAQGALRCVEGLLRHNPSNQSYFSETALPPTLCALLLFPPDMQSDQAPPQEFSLQFWDNPKLANATVVVGIMGLLLGTKGGDTKTTLAFIRCFLEIGAASNAPTSLKALALRLLPAKPKLPLVNLFVTPYMPVPETNGEEWDRLEPISALDALIELAIHGEYNGTESAKRTRDSLELRTVALNIFKNFVREDDIGLAIVQAMLQPENASLSSLVLLLRCLLTAPTSPLDLGTVTSTQLSAFIFSHLLRSSPKAQPLSLSIYPPITPTDKESSFFVPADNASLPAPPPAAEAEEPEPPQSLLQITIENLTLSLLSRSRADASDSDLREWDRLVVAYLCLLSQWLWDDPKVVKEFLDAGGLGMLVEPINQSSEVDPIVPGLCAFLLGACYEFNREPGEITRFTIRPIMDRLGIGTLSECMTRVREDERFHEVGPDTMVLSYPNLPHLPLGAQSGQANLAEIWFDWTFVEFWKSNQYTIQNALATEPDSLTSSGQNAEATILVASLREIIRTQAQEIESLQQRLSTKSSGGEELEALKKQVESLSSQLRASEARCKDVEKEQEDLLVLLDEVSSKRRKDKGRLRAAGLEVSDEGEDEGD